MQENRRDWLSGYHIRHTADLARKYHEHGFALQANGSKDVLANSNVSEDEARKVWYDTGKHERYAILGELINRTIATAVSHISERQPFGLIKKRGDAYEVVKNFVESSDLFTQARGYFDDTLLSAQEETMGQLEDTLQNLTPESKKDRTIYKRHFDWINFGKNNILRQGRVNAKTVLSGGIVHATDVMADLLRVIPVVYKRDTGGDVPSPSDLTAVALHSYPTIVYLASFEIAASFIQAKLYLNGPRMDMQLSPDQFVLEKDKRGIGRIAIKNEIRQDLNKIRTDVVPMKGPRLNCPALIDFGNEDATNAMKSLWYWHVAVGEALYQYLYSSQAPKS